MKGMSDRRLTDRA